MVNFSSKPADGQSDRQMTDGELEVENARGRSVAFVTVIAVGMFALAFFFQWLVQKEASKQSGDSRLLWLDAINSHKAEYILGNFCQAIGSLLVAAMLLHLALAVRSRRPWAPKLIVYLAIAGPVIVAITLPLTSVVLASIASDFANGSVHTAAEAAKVYDSTARQITTLLWGFGQLLLAIGWVMVSIYSMRVGLLTKLVGGVGVAIGAANVIAPPAAAILQVFWLGSVAIMLLGRSQQQPPAWIMGRAVPWSEVRELGLDQKLRENPEEFAKAGGSSNGSSADAPAIDAPAEDKN